MRLFAASMLALATLALGACAKKSDEPAKQPAATTTTGTVKDGVRTINVEASKEGFVPDRIPGKPGEKLKLVFTRTVTGECLSELKTPDGKLLPLPMREPVEVAVTVPADGEVKFACGMEMFFTTVVAEKS